MYKLIVEWDSNKIPDWFLNLCEDEKCKTIGYKRQVSKERFNQMVKEYKSKHPTISDELAIDFISIDYYV